MSVIRRRSSLPDRLSRSSDRIDERVNFADCVNFFASTELRSAIKPIQSKAFEPKLQKAGKIKNVDAFFDRYFIVVSDTIFTQKVEFNYPPVQEQETHNLQIERKNRATYVQVRLLLSINFIMKFDMFATQRATTNSICRFTFFFFIASPKCQLEKNGLNIRRIQLNVQKPIKIELKRISKEIDANPTKHLEFSTQKIIEINQ
uniref:Uncharacterized protein n=1 Tax=Romanomermis culicivorax TaxID=13658 RepID=A0A915ICX3_ROMCU